MYFNSVMWMHIAPQRWCIGWAEGSDPSSVILRTSRRHKYQHFFHNFFVVRSYSHPPSHMVSAEVLTAFFSLFFFGLFHGICFCFVFLPFFSSKERFSVSSINDVIPMVTCIFIHFRWAFDVLREFLIICRLFCSQLFVWLFHDV